MTQPAQHRCATAAKTMTPKIPSDDPKRRKSRDGVARARLLLAKNLAWLPGYPHEADAANWRAFPWQELGGMRSVALNRERVRRLEMTLTKLRHHFPRALPRIVEDVADWSLRMDYLLTLVKSAIHGNGSLEADGTIAEAPLPSRWRKRFALLRKQAPHLQPLLDAIYYLELTGRKAPRLEVLDWVEENLAAVSAAVQNTGVEAALALCTLAPEVDAVWLQTAFSLLSDRRIDAVPKGTADYVKALERQATEATRCHTVRLPAPPAGKTLRQSYWEFVARLLEIKPRRRRIGTALLEAVTPPDIVASIGSLGERVRLLETTLGKFANAERSRQRRFLDRLATLIEKPVSADQSLCDVERWRKALSSVLAIDERLATGVLAVLSHLAPADRAVGLQLLDHWSKVAAVSSEKQTVFVLRQLGSLLARRGVAAPLLAHWTALLPASARFQNEFVDGLIVSTHDCPTLKRTFELLERVVYDARQSLSPEQLCGLEEVAAGATNVVRAGKLHPYLPSEALVCEASAKVTYFAEDEIRATLAIGGGDQDARILEAIDEDGSLAEWVGLLGSHVVDEHIREVVRRWLLAGRTAPLRRLGLLVQALHATGAVIPALERRQADCPWSDEYPAELRSVLTALAEFVDDAQGVARGLLGKHFPDRDGLKREIDHLEQQLAGQSPPTPETIRLRQARRLANLRARLSSPAVLSPARTARLIEKLRERVDGLLIERFEASCRARLAVQLQMQWGLGAEAEAIALPPLDEVPWAVLKEDGRTRQLGMWVLARHLKTPHDDFRTEPSNVAFLQRMDSLGVNLAPWLSADFHTVAVDGEGRPYVVRFTRSVLDVLLMGRRFETCLSPGEVNFFSALTNAVDVNKQVVYGFAAKGRIIGRCLFTLTDDGRILTYRCYSHKPADRFEEAVGLFAERLAQQMNVQRATAGRVSTLVAKRWYDDGPIGPAEALDFQSPDGHVRTLLATTPSSMLLPALSELFGGEEALRSALPTLLGVEDFRARPSLIEPFVERYGSSPSLPLVTRIRIATFARAAGLHREARAIVEAVEIATLVRELARAHCRECRAFHSIGPPADVYDLVCEANPTVVLRLLRRTRPRHVRDDLEEVDRVRRRALALAHAKLGRIQLSQRLLPREEYGEKSVD
jgi:hypothetical protein